MTELDALRQLLRPTAESDTPVDRERMSESWGKEFPSDFRHFVEVGAGTRRPS
ncbi:hypothetical protein [Streptomyces litmocidini]|uniref:Uncharacterized protein n=1 Tax=Streptomyces litmocidini TaxID=67318 RepID=A0ABW7U6L5_9ACTN